ncbi:hypothetical protein PM082_013295 [Marasmius tenuissimus]|nr:hypothetical protein PM082_013295 [Marasmius tenuissimus]
MEAIACSGDPVQEEVGLTDDDRWERCRGQTSRNLNHHWPSRSLVARSSLFLQDTQMTTHLEATIHRILQRWVLVDVECPVATRRYLEEPNPYGLSSN